ncbi:YjbQ family protein [Candidatus Pacearchaeota archaeon]|nr:YjbQ family protein [Candidatus Pacearchaeota archaeon]
MKILNESINLKTRKEFEIINITDKIISSVRKSKIRQGFVNIFSRHTTLALKINENEKLLLKDMHDFLEKIAPKNKRYNHDKLELRHACLPNEPKNARGHIKNLVLETSQIIPINNHEICLGRWQNVFAIETSGPRKREIMIQIIGL